MRILHTADWHLGRLFHQLHLTDDQAHVLDQFVAFARDARPDVILIAGDIYDRSVPPPEAVTLLDETLYRLVSDCAAPVVLIAGNHDSAQRLNFASRLLAERGVHVIGASPHLVATIPLQDADGPVHLYAIPYAEPAVVRERLGDDTIHDHDAALHAILATVRATHPTQTRAIVLAHAFVAGGATAEDSERPLSVGGTGVIAPSCFAGFDYTALGHLHRPQSLADGHIRYAGSLLKYSFSEADQPKSVSLVEMDASGLCHTEAVALSPRHDVRRISGNLHDLLATPDPHASREDYLEVTLLDTGAILDAMGKLREVYPNVLHIERQLFAADGVASGARTDHRALNLSTLFSAFFNEVTGEPMSDEETRVFAELMEQHQRSEREVAAV